MKTKIIPFDLETAKKIQAGEIRGKIKQLHGEEVEVICWDLDNPTGTTLAVKHRFFDMCDDDCGIHVDEYYNNGECWDRSDSMTHNDLVLEVPDNEPQFKPFDKVLVRDYKDEWHISFFSHIKNDWFVTNNGHMYKCCTPYAGNEHLVGTTDKPKED